MTCHGAGSARPRNIMRRLRRGKTADKWPGPSLPLTLLAMRLAQELRSRKIAAESPLPQGERGTRVGRRETVGRAKRSVPTIIAQAPTPASQERRRTSPQGGGMQSVAALRPDMRSPCRDEVGRPGFASSAPSARGGGAPKSAVRMVRTLRHAGASRRASSGVCPAPDPAFRLEADETPSRQPAPGRDS